LAVKAGEPEPEQSRWETKTMAWIALGEAAAPVIAVRLLYLRN
jgi:hypothetical protein